MIVTDEYILTTDNSNLPLTTDEVNDHLKESFVDITTEDLIPLFIKAVEKIGEQFTRRVFLTKTYTNYRTGWFYNQQQCRIAFELRRSKLGVITSVNYIDIDGVEQTINASNYATTFSDEYSTLYFLDVFNFPTMSTENPQPLNIVFTAGYGLTESSIPQNIKTAMLNHLAKLWKHRGDCPEEGKGFENWMSALMPPSTKLIYSMERIPDMLI